MQGRGMRTVVQLIDACTAVRAITVQRELRLRELYFATDLCSMLDAFSVFWISIGCSEEQCNPLLACSQCYSSPQRVCSSFHSHKVLCTTSRPCRLAGDGRWQCHTCASHSYSLDCYKPASIRAVAQHCQSATNMRYHNRVSASYTCMICLCTIAVVWTKPDRCSQT